MLLHFSPNLADHSVRYRRRPSAGSEAGAGPYSGPAPRKGPQDSVLCPAPADWISPVTGKCDSDKLEVADPLVTHLFRLGGYQLQDVAFLSWFSQDAPSNGIGGAYDLRGVLTAPATICSMP